MQGLNNRPKNLWIADVGLSRWYDEIITSDQALVPGAVLLSSAHRAVLSTAQ
jgi:hypothetical protein